MKTLVREERKWVRSCKGLMHRSSVWHDALLSIHLLSAYIQLTRAVPSTRQEACQRTVVIRTLAELFRDESCLTQSKLDHARPKPPHMKTSKPTVPCLLFKQRVDFRYRNQYLVSRTNRTCPSGFAVGLLDWEHSPKFMAYEASWSAKRKSVRWEQSAETVWSIVSDSPKEISCSRPAFY